MKHAYVFPGQGAQAVGMGKDLYDNVPEAKALFEQANEILGFRITDIMFAGTPDEAPIYGELALHLARVVFPGADGQPVTVEAPLPKAFGVLLKRFAEHLAI